MDRTRRLFLTAMAGSAAVGGGAIALRVFFDARTATAGPGSMTVWKAATCGCCGAWVDHVRNAGFAVTVHEVEDVEPVKARLGVPPALHSCHTAVIGDYVLEGHVPADSVLRLLRERPKAAGLAVPGMPQGSPGMETGVKEAYQVVLFGGGAAPRVFETR